MSTNEILAAGRAALQAGDADRAIDILGQIGSTDPQPYAQALLMSGQAYMRKGLLDQAKVCLEESYLHQKHPRTLYHLGEVLHQLKDPKGAESCLTAACQADESLTDAFILLGMIRKESGRLKESVPSFERALQNDAKALVARYMLAQVTYELGDLQRASAQAHLVLQQNEAFAPAHLLLANITLKLGDFRQAAVEFCRVLDLRGGDVSIYMSLGRAFANLKDFEQALSAFEAALQLDPQHEQACSAAARLAERQGLMDRASAHYRKLLGFPGTTQMASEALKRLGQSADPPAAPKKSKKGAKSASPAPQAEVATRFRPPESMSRELLPSSLPNRPTSRVIPDRGTKPIQPPKPSSAPLPVSPPPPKASATSPLDNLFGGINRLIDKSPLKGSTGDLAGKAQGLAGKANELAGMAQNLAAGKANELAGKAQNLAVGKASDLAGKATDLAGKAQGVFGRLTAGLGPKPAPAAPEPADPPKPTPPRPKPKPKP